MYVYVLHHRVDANKWGNHDMKRWGNVLKLPQQPQCGAPELLAYVQALLRTNVTEEMTGTERGLLHIRLRTAGRTQLRSVVVAVGLRLIKIVRLKRSLR